MGKDGVGRDCLLKQFITNHFVTEYDPADEGDYRKVIRVDEEHCLLHLVNKNSFDENPLTQDQMVRTCHGAILVFSITDKNSLEDLKKSPETRVLADRGVPMILAGTKLDLEAQRTVSAQEAGQFAQLFCEGSWFETSAKTRTNVDELFTEMVRKIRRRKREQELHQPIRRCDIQ